MVRRSSDNAQLKARSSAALLAGGGELFDVDQLGGVVAGVAGVTVFVLLIVADGFAQAREREVANGIGFGKFTDLFHVVVARDQFAARRGIDAVEARRDRRRAGDA